jgi:predicted RNase H-like HicB family nuclease
MRIPSYNFTVIFTPAEEGGYTVTCPALPGIVTEGDNLREARKMAREAIAGYIEVLIKHGQPVPEDSRIRAEQISIIA